MLWEHFQYRPHLQQLLLLLPQPLYLGVDAPQPGLVLALYAARCLQCSLALLELLCGQLGDRGQGEESEAELPSRAACQ